MRTLKNGTIDGNTLVFKAGMSNWAALKDVPELAVFLGGVNRGASAAGGDRRRDPVEAILLESGDAFVFGGPARLRYHGVSRIVRGTAPPELAMTGRFNLTFRQYDV